MTVTIKELNKAKYWGYKYIVDFIRNDGTPFRDAFFGKKDMQDFIRKAGICGVTVKEIKEI